MGKYDIFSYRGFVTRRLSSIFVSFDLISICNVVLFFYEMELKRDLQTTPLRNYTCDLSSIKKIKKINSTLVSKLKSLAFTFLCLSWKPRWHILYSGWQQNGKNKNRSKTEFNTLYRTSNKYFFNVSNWSSSRVNEMLNYRSERNGEPRLRLYHFVLLEASVLCVEQWI